MAQATTQTRVIKQYVEVEVKDILLELNQYEAATLRRIVGSIGGRGPRREVASNIYRLLTERINTDEPTPPQLACSNNFQGEM